MGKKKKKKKKQAEEWVLPLSSEAPLLPPGAVYRYVRGNFSVQGHGRYDAGSNTVTIRSFISDTGPTCRVKIGQVEVRRRDMERMKEREKAIKLEPRVVAMAAVSGKLEDLFGATETEAEDVINAIEEAGVMFLGRSPLPPVR